MATSAVAFKPRTVVSTRINATRVVAPTVTMSQYRRLRLLNLGERLLVKFSCRNHNWSMPFTLPGHSYPTLDGIAYDSHRTCVDCSVSQLYNSRSFTPGPLFEDVIPNVERVPVVA